MTREEIEELAALYAAGALDGPEQVAFEQLLQEGHAEACASVARLQDAAAAMGAATATAVAPPAGLKDKVLQAATGNSGSTSPPARPGSRLQDFLFVPHSETEGWMPMKVPGAYIKLLSFNPDKNYAVVLGKLDPGASYPPHDHSGAEELFMLTGDLKVGDRVLGPGDFHYAAAGTHHEENSSVEGCTLLAVINSREVLEEMGLL